MNAALLHLAKIRYNCPGYVGQLIQELIENGKLVTAETRHGTGIRTATAAELAQPLPGQQAMGGMSGPC